jgi:hypothetical protein
MLSAMHMRNAICTLVLGAFIASVSWLLDWLAPVLGLSVFVIFCVVTFAIMVSCGYLFDYLTAHPSSGERNRTRQ